MLRAAAAPAGTSQWFHMCVCVRDPPGPSPTRLLTLRGPPGVEEGLAAAIPAVGSSVLPSPAAAHGVPAPPTPPARPFQPKPAERSAPRSRQATGSPGLPRPQTPAPGRPATQRRALHPSPASQNPRSALRLLLGEGGMMSLPEGGGRSRHDPGRLARPPARPPPRREQPGSGRMKRLHPGEGDGDRPGRMCWAGHLAPHSPAHPEGRAHRLGRLGHLLSDAGLHGRSSSLEPSPGRGGLATQPGPGAM